MLERMTVCALLALIQTLAGTIAGGAHHRSGLIVGGCVADRQRRSAV